MSHARETLRSAITTAVTGLTTTGGSVFTNHAYPFEDSTLPNLSIYFLHEPETSEPDDQVMGDYEFRAFPFQVVARVKATSELDNTLDDICSEVETAIHGNAALSGYVKDIRLISTEFELDGEGEKPVGAARMEWVAVYRVNRTAPTAPVN